MGSKCHRWPRTYSKKAIQKSSTITVVFIESVFGNSIANGWLKFWNNQFKKNRCFQFPLSLMTLLFVTSVFAEELYQYCGNWSSHWLFELMQIASIVYNMQNFGKLPGINLTHFIYPYWLPQFCCYRYYHFSNLRVYLPTYYQRSEVPFTIQLPLIASSICSYYLPIYFRFCTTYEELVLFIRIN